MHLTIQYSSKLVLEGTPPNVHVLFVMFYFSIFETPARTFTDTPKPRRPRNTLSVNKMCLLKTNNFFFQRLQRPPGNQFSGVPPVMLLPKTQGDALQPTRPGVSAIYSNRGQLNKQIPPNVKLVQKRRPVPGSTMQVSRSNCLSPLIYNY